MSKIWVGEINGAALVFDPDIQLPNCPHVFLWALESKEVEKYVAATARSNVKALQNEGMAQQHIAAYETWREAHGAEWLALETNYYLTRQLEERKSEERRLEKRKLEAISRNIVAARDAVPLWKQRTGGTLEKRHIEFLQQYGQTYRGVTIRPSNHKNAFKRCWDCKQRLIPSPLMCTTCRWILCNCGACGCGAYFEERLPN